MSEVSQARRVTRTLRVSFVVVSVATPPVQVDVGWIKTHKPPRGWKPATYTVSQAVSYFSFTSSLLFHTALLLLAY